MKRRIRWQARKQAERAFTVSIRIERDTGKTVYDPESFMEKPEVVLVWAGLGKVAEVTAGGADADIASAPLPYSGYLLHVPVGVPDLFDGDVVTVIEDRFGDMAGRVFTVTQPSRRKTHVTALRVPVEEVSVRGGRN